MKVNTQKKPVTTYEAFVDKFKPKRTTDDCYTPPSIYESVLEWVRERYGISPETRIVRPFYPEGDYERADYSGDCVVVDNPPFSILTKIVRHYQARRIRFFLFAPTLTNFTTGAVAGVTCLPCGVAVTYENGAVVNTSFITSLSPELKVEGSVSLSRAVTRATESLNKTRTLPKYEYPREVVTSTKVATLVKYGVDVQIPADEALFVRALDSQRAVGKEVFGSGLLVSEAVAEKLAEAERRAQAEREARHYYWTISPREREAIKRLGASSAPPHASTA